jgi:signal transduction histidine kinase
MVSKLFNPSEKVTHTGTAGEEGNGLGLILSDEFAQRNKGRLTVQSEEGKGAVFTLFLPKP